MMERKAVFPGTFDPFTLGHESVVRKAIPLFDQIIVAIGKNSTKNAYFDIEQRTEWIRQCFADEPSVIVDHFSGLTVDYCLSKGCNFILRGLRNPADFQYESSIAQMNHAMKPEVTTVLLICEPKYAAINSTIVREIHKSGGDISQFIPSSIKMNK
ncbi:MAG: pantetheine-phosphate adenylyltransferase [Flavobacteriales bacterium]